MSPRKRSFFERLTGVVRFDDEDEVQEEKTGQAYQQQPEEQFSSTEQENQLNNDYWEETPQEKEEAELTIDMYETASSLILKTLVAGVIPDELDITITREMVTIRGERADREAVSSGNYYYQELFWGSFSRTINLPKEIDVEEAEAIEKHGLLEIRLPKINKDREAKVKVRTG